MAYAADADTVVVDSLVDAAARLSGGEAGAGWNRARQAAIAAGVDWSSSASRATRQPTIAAEQAGRRVRLPTG